MCENAELKDKGYNELKEKCNSGVFEHYISLGHCCFVAMDLEEMGLRDASLPFDWTRTRWKAIERSFKTHFESVLDYDCLFQKRNNQSAYKNLEYGIGFFHDFNQYDSLESQLKEVQEKYDKRIERLFRFINQPSLFIRYCWDEDELLYVSVHYDEIKRAVKKSNAMNDIVFVSNSPCSNVDLSSIDYIFFIEMKVKDDFNIHPIKSNELLFDILCNARYEKRLSNLQFRIEKQKQKARDRKRIKGRIKRKINKIIHKKIYIHKKQC